MKLLRSLRWRIQIWHGLLLVGVLAILGLAAFRHQQSSDLRRVDHELRERVAVMMDSLPVIAPRPAPGAGARPVVRAPDFVMPAERAALFDPDSVPAFYYVTWKRDGGEWARSAGAPPDVTMPQRPARGSLGEVDRSRGEWREAFAFTPPGECLLVGRSIKPELEAQKDFLRGIVTTGLAILALALGGGWWLTSRALRPLDAIRTTAGRIAEGRLTERIEATETESELGELACVLDGTFARLEASFAEQARFTADAAHELCTPISIIKSHAQSGLRGERSPAEYREMLNACLRAAQRMEKLTQSLLDLAQHDATGDAQPKSRCDLATLARDSAELLAARAETRHITLRPELESAVCHASADGISQIILNLLTNALEHTPEAGCITLQTRTEARHAIFSVTDSGPGIAPEHLAHLFNRFYRADPSRSRSTGGAGLGLAISKAIADAHGGKLDVVSTPGGGSTFTLTLAASAV